MNNITPITIILVTLAASAHSDETTTVTTTTTLPLWFFELEKPGATILIGSISVVHSLFHIPHCLMYRRLGIITAFWSLVGLGLMWGAVMENEFFYDIWIWYSCVYVPVMLITMSVVLTAYIWEMNMKLLRVAFATLAVMFYLFMFYCIVFVNDEKRAIFTTTSTTAGSTTGCPDCKNCSGDGVTTTTLSALREGNTGAGQLMRNRIPMPKFVRFYRHLVDA